MNFAVGILYKSCSEKEPTFTNTWIVRIIFNEKLLLNKESYYSNPNL